MARKPATAENIVPGSQVWESRTGKASLTVVGLEWEEQYPDAPPIVLCELPSSQRVWRAMHELWTRA